MDMHHNPFTLPYGNRMRNHIEDLLRLRHGKSLHLTMAILQLEFPYLELGHQCFSDFLRSLDIDTTFKNICLDTVTIPQPVHYVPGSQEISVKVGDRVSWPIHRIPEWGTVKWVASICKTNCAGIDFNRKIGVPLPPLVGFIFECKPGHGRILPFTDLVKPELIDLTGDDEEELEDKLESGVSQPLVSISPSSPSQSEPSELLSPADAVPAVQMLLPVSSTAVSESSVLSAVENVSAASVSLSDHVASLSPIAVVAKDDADDAVVPNPLVLLPPFQAEPDTPAHLVPISPAEDEPFDWFLELLDKQCK